MTLWVLSQILRASGRAGAGSKHPGTLRVSPKPFPVPVNAEGAGGGVGAAPAPALGITACAGQTWSMWWLQSCCRQ